MQCLQRRSFLRFRAPMTFSSWLRAGRGSIPQCFRASGRPFRSRARFLIVNILELTLLIEFNPYDKAFANDPYPIYKQLRDEAPVYHCSALNFWAISRYADVLEAHRDFKTYSSAGGVTIEGYDAMVPLLIVKDPPEHRWHKALITRVFTPNRMGALEPFIRNLVTSLLDQAAHKSEFDFVKEFALQVPLQVI